jgi:flagellar motor switch protein FliN/FliY
MEENEQTIWKIFKTQFNKVFQELLQFDNELLFDSTPQQIAKLKKTIDPSPDYLKVEIEVVEGSKSGKMMLFYDAEVATSIEYFMLMGFSEKLEGIESSTIDANQEFTQNLLDNVKSAITSEDLGIYDFNISKVSMVIDTSLLETTEYKSFLSFNWEQTAMEHTVSDDIYLLLSFFAEGVLEPKAEDNEIELLEEAHNSSEQEQVYVVEIEDCDKRKTIFKEELDNLKLILDVELKLSVRIGTKQMLLKDIVNIDIGTTIELEQLSSEPLDLLINGVKIAEGEVVVVEGKFGIQIVKISSKIERLSKLKFKN